MNTEDDAHSNNQNSYTKRLEFEEFLANLSAKFVSLPPERVDEEICSALEEIRTFFQIDRCSLLHLLPGKMSYLVSHNADNETVTPYPLRTALPVSLFPFFYNQLAVERRIVSFSRIEDLPEEAAVDKPTLEAWKVRSGLYIPVAALRSSAEYTFGISSGKNGEACPEEYITRMRLLGQLFVNALERASGEIALRERLAEIERLRSQLEKENLYLREEVKADRGFEKIVGSSDALNYVLFKVKQVAPTDATVLILGETGTGKGMVAHAIHEMSPRKDRPLVVVDCAALPANLIESELFGRERGAFTGAHAKQSGRFEIADGGTIFLDEIGEMPLELQAKLLRALQEGKFERLGSPRTIEVDVRVIAATSRDLKAEVQNKRFREDLFYRINVFPISIPPLRMRRDDIPRLVRHFVDKHARKIGRKYETIPKNTMKALQNQSWPGNVRELEHVIERAVIASPGPVLRLSDWLETGFAEPGEAPIRALETIEREHILKTLEETNWKIDGKGGAASVLGLHPSTLRFRLKKLDIKRP